MSTEPTRPASSHAEDSMEGYVGPERRRMPDERRSITERAVVGGFRFYVTAGMYEDGTLGEVFVKDAGKTGSTTQGLLDSFATMMSIALQYGTPLDMLARKFAHMRFEPNGATENPRIPHAHSVIDYIVRWLALRFGSDELNAELARISEELGQ